MAAMQIPTMTGMQTRPEPMNASTSHSKVKVSLTLSDPLFVAGNVISGKMEMECRADAGLGIGIMMVELVAIQELTSRDHSATSTFLQSRRLFQGPGLPPSNAVLPYPIHGEPELPQDYHQARRGQTTFFFQIPTPPTSPSSINYGNGLACIRYEVRCAVGVAWKGELRLVTDKKNVEVVESYEEDDFTRVEPEGVTIGENRKIWVQGKVVGGLVVAGQSACVELQVKNHSPKRTTGLQITLMRNLYLPLVPPSEKTPLEISDTLTTVAFRGPEYIVHPGTESVASLVFDVPRSARSVKGGPRESDEEEGKITECLFEVRCTLDIKIGVQFGSKDIVLALPVTILHPSAAPQLPISPERFNSPNLYGSPGHVSPLLTSSPHPYLDRAQSPYAYPALPMSPPLLQQYTDHTSPPSPWLPPPPQIPGPYQYFSPPLLGQQYYPPPFMQSPLYIAPPRPLSTEPNPSHALYELPPGLSDSAGIQHQYLMLPLEAGPQQPATPEEGKGERASRIAQHLRLSSRHRSVSPQSHRFPLPAGNTDPMPATMVRNLPLPPHVLPHLNLANLSAPPPEEGIVHSPRPMLSPKHSFTIDPITHHSLPKSERVEELERMAEEVEHQKKNLSDDIPKALKVDIEKTLPSPPVPSGKINLPSRPPVFNRPGVDALFASTRRQPALTPSSETPPTPTLTAITPARLPRKEGLGSGLREGKNESGLDALERRLLAEVGTRKMINDDIRTDVRSVLPIPIPSTVAEPLNDSAISSLSLADHDHDHDHDSDGRTHQPRRQSQSEDDRDVIRRRKVSATNIGEGISQGKEKEWDGRAGKRKERVRDDEAHRLRRSAKGRVAAWLGGIDPDAPPLSPSLTSFVQHGSTIEPAGPANDMNAVTADLHKDAFAEFSSVVTLADVTSAEEVPSAPNPRSSGFVPLATLKQSDGRRQSGVRMQPHAREAAESATPGFTRQPKSIPQSPTADRVVPQPSRAANANVKNRWPQPSKASPAPRLPSFPPSSLVPEIKYDIKSARGGRGGKVAAVASIWASLTADNTSTKPVAAGPKPRDGLSKKPAVKSARTSPPQASSSSNPASLSPLESSLPDLSARRARLSKSASVPAIVSSSHAVPTLSSTASLARPSPQLDRRKTPVKVPQTVSDSESQLFAQTTAKSQHSPGDLAFGQARLRDLIKKYQG